MSVNIRNIEELFAQHRPLSDLTMERDISIEDSLKGAKRHYEILKNAIENFNTPEGQTFFKPWDTYKLKLKRAKMLLKSINVQIKILESQILYRKFRASGGEKIDFFEWE